MDGDDDVLLVEMRQLRGGSDGLEGGRRGKGDGAARLPRHAPSFLVGPPPREARGHRMTHPCQQVPCSQTRVALYPGDHWDTS